MTIGGFYDWKGREFFGKVSRRWVFLHMTIVETIENMDSLLTLDGLSKLLTISEKTLYKAIKAGRLPGYRLGGSVRLEPAEVAKWLRQRSTRA